MYENVCVCFLVLMQIEIQTDHQPMQRNSQIKGAFFGIHRLSLGFFSKMADNTNNKKIILFDAGPRPTFQADGLV